MVAKNMIVSVILIVITIIYLACCFIFGDGLSTVKSAYSIPILCLWLIYSSYELIRSIRKTFKDDAEENNNIEDDIKADKKEKNNEHSYEGTFAAKSINALQQNKIADKNNIVCKLSFSYPLNGLKITEEGIFCDNLIIGTYKNEEGNISVSIRNGATITLVSEENYYIPVNFAYKDSECYGPGLYINNMSITDSSGEYLCSFEGDKNAALAAFVCISAKIHTSGKYHDFFAS